MIRFLLLSFLVHCAVNGERFEHEWVVPCGNQNITKYNQRRRTGISEWPFQVQVIFIDHFRKNNEKYSESGIIIDRNMILTRAYLCEVTPKVEIEVYPGRTYVGQQVQVHYVEEYVLHEDRARIANTKTYDDAGRKFPGHYSMKIHPMDFCLLRLSVPLTLSTKVQKAPLPTHDEPFDMSLEYSTAGWGGYFYHQYLQNWQALDWRKKVHEGRAPLYYHVAKPMGNAQCLNYLKSTIPGIQALRPEYFCMGPSCHDFKAAIGDGGSPVYCSRTQKVVAMNGYVDHFTELDKPQLAMKMSYAVVWINEMRNKWNKLGAVVDY